jgi:hypothetical protein
VVKSTTVFEQTLQKAPRSWDVISSHFSWQGVGMEIRSIAFFFEMPQLSNFHKKKLLNDHFIHHFLSQCLIYPLFYFFPLVDQFMFEGGNSRCNDQLIADDLEFIRVAGYRFSHDLFPHIFYLQSLYAAFDTAFGQKFFNGITDGKFAHETKLEKVPEV